MGRRISKEFLHPSILEGVNNKIGNLDSLETDAKGNMVQAINELVEKLDNSAEIENGKELIANAVGEPLTAEDSFDEMSNDINSLLSQFKTNMMNNGITVNSGDKFKQLIDKIATMVEEGSGKGVMYKTGTYNIPINYNNTTTETYNIDFTPSIVFIEINKDNILNNEPYSIPYTKILYSDEDKRSYTDFTMTYSPNNGGVISRITIRCENVNIIENGFTIDHTTSSDYNYIYNSSFNITYHAIGVGEEDTTLRDSLASILENKGVEVTEEDGMASLITKVDERIVDIDIKNIICGYCTSFLIKKDNSLWGCGLNSNIGTTNNMNTFTHLMDDVKQVAANGTNGDQHVMVLKNDGSLWGCGDNSKGQLGLNDATDKTTFTQVTTNINNDVKQIACGSFYTMILKNDGSLWACGHNEYGQLGLGNTSNKTTFTQVTTNINNDVKQIACTFSNTWVLKNDGSLWACGWNEYGHLGLGDTTNRNTFTQIITNVKQIYAGVSNSIFIIKNDGTLWACGYNYYGQLGIGTNTQGFISFTQVNINANDIKCIACAHTVTVLIKNDGTLWGCGYNSGGELGSIFPSTSQYTFVKISQKSDNYKVCCGLDHVIVLKNDNSIWGSGNNYCGQLGLGYASSDDVRTFNCVGGSF